MVKTPTQSFPKFSFPLSNYWGLYTIPNYWVIASGTPSAPPYTSFVFGKNFFCVWKYFFCVWKYFFCVCEYFFRIIKYFHTRSITRWHFHSRKVDSFHAKLISHLKKRVSKKNSAWSPKKRLNEYCGGQHHKYQVCQHHRTEKCEAVYFRRERPGKRERTVCLRLNRRRTDRRARARLLTLNWTSNGGRWSNPAQQRRFWAIEALWGGRPGQSVGMWVFNKEANSLVCIQSLISIFFFEHYIVTSRLERWRPELWPLTADVLVENYKKGTFQPPILNSNLFWWISKNLSSRRSWIIVQFVKE